MNTLTRLNPGIVLGRELNELHISARQLSRHLGVSQNAATELINGNRAITPEMAVRLGRAFRTMPEYWMRLQVDYDLRRAERTIAEEAERITPLVELGTVQHVN